MTQSEFIEKVNEVAGISFRNATLSSWENGQSSPTGDLLPVIARILETPVSHLFSDEPVQKLQPVNINSSDGKLEESVTSYGSPANTGLYRRIFEENPEEAFNELLKDYIELVQSNETLKAEKQKLEGKLAASAEFLKQLMDMKK